MQQDTITKRKAPDGAVPFTVFLPHEQWLKLKFLSAESRTSMKELVAIAVRRYLESEGQKAA